ncbi:MAG: tRNA (5-methylaminomethyl-2-thiouridine)(34)-methyltransferase MnmD [Cyclobacteriaceae bacterium]|nr:tRNA (5-methylaminomethyl-2-thiouridine)(34)-methyltransferase MnmD [Cyclobacteriaceae bacterium]
MKKGREIKLFITEDGSHSLEIPTLNETYHSSHGAIQESNHVFIKNGQEYWVEQNQSNRLSIFEVGFGTGLNALLTMQKSEQLSLKIDYTSLELYPLTSELTNQLNYAEQTGFDKKAFQKLHSCHWNEPIVISSYFNLHKIKGSFQDISMNSKFDIIYYDAFAPSKQPEMWTYKLMEKCFAMLNPNGLFVTYSARGQLKRDLKQAGFKVESLPGPPGKFEMVRAVKET